MFGYCPKSEWGQKFKAKAGDKMGVKGGIKGWSFRAVITVFSIVFTLPLDWAAAAKRPQPPQERTDREIAENPRNMQDLVDLAKKLNKREDWGVNAYILQYAINNIPGVDEAMTCAERTAKKDPLSSVHCFRAVIYNLPYAAQAPGGPKLSDQLYQDFKEACYSFTIASGGPVDVANQCLTAIDTSRLPKSS